MYKIILMIIFSTGIIACSGAGNSSNNTCAKSIKDFGAIGDGVSDDTENIQNALNWLSNNSCSLEFPDGVYNVSESLNLILNQNSELRALHPNNVAIKMINNFTSPTYVILAVNGGRKKLGIITNNTTIGSNEISLANNTLKAGDTIIIAEDLLESGITNIHLTNSHTISTKTTVTTDNNFFDKSMVGKSIVFTINPTLLQTQNFIPDLGLRMNEPVQGSTVMITNYISPVEVKGIIGNNNYVPASATANSQWGIIQLWDAARGYYIKGEINQVESINNNKIFLKNPLKDNYTKNFTQIYKISNAKFKVDGINFSGIKNGNTDTYNVNFAVLLNDINDVEVNNANIGSANGVGLYINEVNHGTINNISTNNISLTGSRYGLLLASSQNIEVNNSHLATGSHAFATGGTFPVRNITLNKDEIDDNSYNYAFDFHGNADGVNLNDIYSKGGFTYVGINLNINNSSFFGSHNNTTDPMAANSMIFWPERSGNYLNINKSTFYSESSDAFVIQNYFVDKLNESNFGSYESINIDNSNIYSINANAINLMDGVVVPSFNFNYLNITNKSSLNSINGAAIKVSSLDSEVNLINLNINKSGLNTINYPVLDIIPDNNNIITGNNILINYNQISSSNESFFIINNINSINLNNNSLKGKNVAQILKVKNFNNLNITNNDFINWSGINNLNDLNNMLNDTANINSYNESAVININFNNVY